MNDCVGYVEQQTCVFDGTACDDIHFRDPCNGNEEGKGDDGFDESVSLNKSNNELNELYVFV